MGVITSTHNKRVVQAIRLKKRALRERDRSFLVEGAQGVLEALDAEVVREVFHTPGEGRLDSVVDAAGRTGVPLRAVTPEVMAHLTSTVTPQGVVAVAGFVDVPLDDVVAVGGFVPVLVEVRDPGNAGTILRSADGSGAAGVVFTSSSVDVYNSKAVRATAGSLFHVPVVRQVAAEAAVARLREAGYRILAAEAEGPSSVYDSDLTGPTAVLFGNEARGLDPEAAGLADRSVRVPISGRAESLNLAAAATLILFEAARQRSEGARQDTLARIIAGAAHDIRSPLTALKGFGSTLVSRWDRLTAEQRLMMLEGIAHDAARMGVIVTQLVDAARLASGTLNLAPILMDLLAIAHDVAAEVTRWGTSEVEVAGEKTLAIVDGPRTRTILLALVEGAAWFGEDGPVRVSVRGEQDGARVTVWRRGSTLHDGDADALFRPRQPGTGGGSKLGLYLAKQLAEALGGGLQVRAAPDVAFELSIPGAR